MSKTFKEKLHQIKCFIFDVDGVFTDGTVMVMANGDQNRNMNIKDGYALQHAIKQGYKVAIISGGSSEGVRTRFKGLGVTDIYLGQRHKLGAFEDYLAIYNLNPEEILYMGDDLPDYEVMQKVGLACCPANAATEIKTISHYISPKNGGDGCVRDVIEQVLKNHAKWLDDTV
mgnify:CR=1 FL=1